MGRKIDCVVKAMLQLAQRPLRARRDRYCKLCQWLHYQECAFDNPSLISTALLRSVSSVATNQRIELRISDGPGQFQG